jgi:hypothetical protein
MMITILLALLAQTDMKSAGPLAFGPEGTLFVGDAVGGAVFAIETGDAKGDPEKAKHDVDGLDLKVAAALGVKASDLRIADLAVNPASGTVYLSVMRGRGPDATPVILKLEDGKLSEVKGKSTKAEIPNLPAPGGEGRNNLRADAITDLAFVDGKVLVAGLSNEEFASTLRSIPYPFSKVEPGTGVEIYHGAHGKFETRSPVRTFAVHQSDVLAAYTCTPLVRFPLDSLKPGAKIKGVTVAELGNRNRPLDMIVYAKGGKDWILMANSSRGVMKISTENIKRETGITEKISDKAGQPYETIDTLKGVVHLDRLNKGQAVVLMGAEGGPLNLKTIDLP